MSPQSTSSSNPVNALLAYISALPTQTAVPTAIQNLVRLLLLHTAWSTESSHLLLGTSLTSLSVSLISSISQGGGFVVREEAQEEWQPTVDITSKRTVRVNRPLRDIAMKECAVWAWWRGLKVVGKENYLSGKQGIGALTKSKLYLFSLLSLVFNCCS
jgi:cytoplasmic tRNA 2-thiolation protein 2